jgi:hypothetical protein
LITSLKESKMETIKSAYRILFAVEFQLEGASYDLNPYLKFVPVEKTAQLISDHQMLARQQKSTNVALIAVEADGVAAGRPFCVPDEATIFRFQLKLNDKSFINRTNISSYDYLNKVLYLSNTVNNVSGSDILLTQNAFVSPADLQLRSTFTETIDYDTFLVLDIKHSAALNASYQLLDGASKCKEVSYKIKLQSN